MAVCLRERERERELVPGKRAKAIIMPAHFSYTSESNGVLLLPFSTDFYSFDMSYKNDFSTQRFILTVRSAWVLCVLLLAQQSWAFEGRVVAAVPGLKVMLTDTTQNHHPFTNTPICFVSQVAGNTFVNQRNGVPSPRPPPSHPPPLPPPPTRPPLSPQKKNSS